MSHQRTTIRQAIKTKLLASSTAAGTRIKTSQTTPQDNEVYPYILITSRPESSKPGPDNSGGGLLRKLKVVIDARLEALNDIDDAADTLADQIETAMKADPTFTGACSWSTLTETELTTEGEGEKPLAQLQMHYEVTYVY